MIIDRRVSGETRLLCLLGNPVEHTISPQLHNTISSHLGLDLLYVPFRVKRECLRDAVMGLRALNFVGFNVTIPFKKDMLKLVDECSEDSVLIGAVNTVRNEKGRLTGFNTDADGFLRSFQEETGTGFNNKKVAIIGAGGAARAIAVKTALEGASEIHILNRTASKAFEIADLINSNISQTASVSESDHNKRAVLSGCDIIINTSSVGMYPDVAGIPIDENTELSSGQIVYDAVYNPSKTRLLQLAEKSGCKTVNGLGMLFYQGILAYEIWTGIELSKEDIKQIYEAFLMVVVH